MSKLRSALAPRFSLNPLLVVLVATLFSGCAAIVHGSSQTLPINTSPNQVHIAVKNGAGVEIASGTAPMNLPLTRKNEYSIELSIAGYEPQKLQLTRGLSGWFWWNFVLGGPVGMIIDYAAGAMWKLQPSSLDIRMRKSEAKDANELLVTFMSSNGSRLREAVLPLVKSSASSDMQLRR
ncbi:MAG: hypothetical protein K2R93_00355 [Gemmatimonadaceae bacterium]|nr:hypothetical protein [Gemmatimonadaceae bacterium]